MSEKRKKIGLFIILLIGFSFVFQTNFFDFEGNSVTKKNLENFDHSGVSEVTKTRQWLVNGNFSSLDNWTSAKGTSGDPDDVDAAISGGTANYSIIGESGKYSISGIPNSTWTAFDNPDWGVGMDEGTERGIGTFGCWVDYTWDEGIDQTGGTPSVHWKRNITLPVDMADYKITSAFLNVTFNATVTVSPASGGGIDVLDDFVDDLQVGDYARFYFLVSDIENVYQPFQLANNRTKYLGRDIGSVSTIGTTSLTNIDETLLINYLELILGVNSTAFTLALGIDIFCEDNIAGQDEDSWDKLRINFINLTFTYEKRIDDQTSVSWNQEGDKPSDIIPNPFVINEAILNFTYKVNDTLPKEISPNSELQILINNIPHSETIKLWTAETTFKNASINGFDVTRLIDKNQNINVSVQLYLADDFELNRTITFSIDDIYLNVTYTEEVTDIETKIQLFLDNMEKTEDPFISLPLGVNLNITIKYTNLTGDYISGATVTLEGKASGTFDEDPPLEQYNITINTNDLGIGVSVLTVIAQMPFYETNQTSFFVEVTERETELLLFLDDVLVNDSDTIGVKVDTPVNITVSFRDNETKQRLPDATVVLVGWGELDETNIHYYNITINTKDLDLGINAFTIFAQLVNYTTNSISFFIDVFERETKYELFLNGVDSTLTPFISITIIETLNITVRYLDNDTDTHIVNATLEYIEIGGDLTGNLTEYETLEFYSEEINATDLGIGVSIINIIAQKTVYQTQNIQFSVEITERDTDILLYINSNPTEDGATIESEIDDLINVTIYYRDNITTEHIPNATVELLNWGMLNETNNQYYNITIDAKDIEQGITIFTVFAEKEYYQSQIIRFFIEINERDTNISLYINGNPTEDGAKIQVEIDEIINITVYYKDNVTKEHLPNATVELLNWGMLNETNNQYYNITIDGKDLDQGITIFTILAQKENYEPQIINFFIELVEKTTTLQLLINGDPTNDSDTIQVEIDELINITVYYKDNDTTEHIPNATVELLNWGMLNETNNQYYNITIDAQDLDQGITIFTIFAQKENYQPQVINFFIEVTERETELLLYINGVLINDSSKIQVEIDDIINIKVYYKDNVTKLHIPNATVELLNWDYLNEINNQYYNITIDAQDLDQGITALTIFAQKENYQPQIINFFIEVVEKETALQLLINGDLIIDGATIQVEIDELINITVYYIDNVTKEHIPNAIVELLNWDYLNETNSQYYNITIHAQDLDQGITIFTIFAQKANYQPQIINFFVEVTERETELLLYINDTPTDDGATIQVEIDDIINITVYYKDNVTKAHIPNALVELLYWDYLNETTNQYSIFINASDLSQIFTALTVFAQKENYQPKIINFFIEVVEKETSLQLLINGDPTNDGDTIQVEFDDTITIVVYYRDNVTSQHIPNALVELLYWDYLNESSNQYSILINASDLTHVITALTIFARKDNYQQQLINFFIEVVEKETILQLFINGDPTNDGDTIQVEFDDTITIVVYYRDNATSQHIPNADVNLIGVGYLNESLNQYSIFINANDLEQGINAFTITAEMDYYQSQSIRFFVELIEKATLIQLILNSIDKTIDPIFNLTIGQSLNLTVKYTDQYGVFIPDATVLLIGKGLSLELMKDNTFDQYYIILNTTELGISSTFFTIIAQKINFESIAKELRITINSIIAEIRTLSGVAQIEAEIGDDVLLQIILNDTIFGTDITDVTVAYNWLYGQGELEDSDKDGIYEVVLENVQEGIYTITITAFAGDNYDFESYEITLVVIPPTESPGPDVSWLIYVLTGGIVGLVTIFTLYQTHYKYPPMVRKIRKLRKKIRKDKKIKPILLGNREDIVKNEFQNQINAIEIEPKKAEDKIIKVENNQNSNVGEL